MELLVGLESSNESALLELLKVEYTCVDIKDGSSNSSFNVKVVEMKYQQKQIHSFSYPHKEFPNCFLLFYSIATADNSKCFHFASLKHVLFSK